MVTHLMVNMGNSNKSQSLNLTITEFTLSSTLICKHLLPPLYFYEKYY